MVGEVPDLPRLGTDVEVAAIVGDPAEVEEEVVHALHLILDEGHLAVDAAQQLRLVVEHEARRLSNKSTCPMLS